MRMACWRSGREDKRDSGMCSKRCWFLYERTYLSSWLHGSVHKEKQNSPNPSKKGKTSPLSRAGNFRDDGYQQTAVGGQLARSDAHRGPSFSTYPTRPCPSHGAGVSSSRSSSVPVPGTVRRTCTSIWRCDERRAGRQWWKVI